MRWSGYFFPLVENGSWWAVRPYQSQNHITKDSQARDAHHKLSSMKSTKSLGWMGSAKKPPIIKWKWDQAWVKLEGASELLEQVVQDSCHPLCYSNAFLSTTPTAFLERESPWLVDKRKVDAQICSQMVGLFCGCEPKVDYRCTTAPFKAGAGR